MPAQRGAWQSSSAPTPATAAGTQDQGAASSSCGPGSSGVSAAATAASIVTAAAAGASAAGGRDSIAGAAGAASGPRTHGGRSLTLALRFTAKPANAVTRTLHEYTGGPAVGTGAGSGAGGSAGGVATGSRRTIAVAPSGRRLGARRSLSADGGDGEEVAEGVERWSEDDDEDSHDHGDAR